MLYMYMCFNAGIQMLLEYFDTNSKYIGSKKITAVLVGKSVSLQLHTDRGAQELTDDQVVNHWKLKPKEALTVQYKYFDCYQAFTIIIMMIVYRCIERRCSCPRHPVNHILLYWNSSGLEKVLQLHCHKKWSLVALKSPNGS